MMKSNLVLLFTMLFCLSCTVVPAAPYSSNTMPSQSSLPFQSRIQTTFPEPLIYTTTKATIPSTQVTSLSSSATSIPDGQESNATVISTTRQGPTSRTLPGMNASSLRSTTTTLYCPNDEKVCYVEFDITGDRKPECCNAGNNPVCARCLQPCIDICNNRKLGVEFCFGSSASFTCECSKESPSCYAIQETTTTTEPMASPTNMADAVKSNPPVYYLLLLIILVLSLAVVIYYLRQL